MDLVDRAVALGKKFVPSTPLRFALPLVREAYFSSLRELHRVLLWALVFKEEEDNYIEPWQRPFLTRSLNWPTPRQLIRVKGEVLQLESHLSTFNRRCLRAFAALESSPPPARHLRGLHISRSSLASALGSRVIVEADKEGSVVVMERTMYRSMLCTHVCDPEVYSFYAPLSSTDAVEVSASTWQDALHAIILPVLRSAPLPLLFTRFVVAALPPSLPTFYLLVKTHKPRKNGVWATRPIVGMSRWCTTTASRFLTVGANILLALDLLRDPLSSPLRNTMDLVGRLEQIAPAVPSQAVLSTVDFTSLYTHFRIEDAIWAVDFWMEDISRLPRDSLSPHQLAFLTFLFTRIPLATYRPLTRCISLIVIPEGREYTLAHILLICVFSVNLFRVPGVGIYQQKQGFAMGTNCAPGWANLILRAYELRSQRSMARPPPSVRLFVRYIDDCLLLHTPCPTHNLQDWLSSVYPPHLPFTFGQVGATVQLQFLDLSILCLSPLRYAVFWKPTNHSLYIPWSSAVPRHTKLGWVKGELIRCIRGCNQKEFFDLCVTRLRQAVTRLGYPKSVLDPLPISWAERPVYLRPTKKPLMAKRITVLRLPFFTCVSINFQELLSHLQANLPFIPHQHILVAFRHPRSLRRLFHSLLVDTPPLPDLSPLELLLAIAQAR